MRRKELERVIVRASRHPVLCILSIEQELGAEVAGWRGVGCTSAMADKAALFAENGTTLDVLVAHAADDGYDSRQQGRGTWKGKSELTLPESGLHE